jgi:hypothetical protein
LLKFFPVLYKKNISCAWEHIFLALEMIESFAFKGDIVLYGFFDMGFLKKVLVFACLFMLPIHIDITIGFSRGNLGEEKTSCHENKRLEFYFALDSSLNSSRGLFSVLWSFFSLVLDFCWILALC